MMDPSMARQEDIRRQKLKDFHRKVKVVLNDSDRDFLYSYLKKYQSTRKLDKLLLALKSILNTPTKLDLLKDIRSFIPPHQVAKYDEEVPYHNMSHTWRSKSMLSLNSNYSGSAGGGLHHRHHGTHRGSRQSLASSRPSSVHGTPIHSSRRRIANSMGDIFQAHEGPVVKVISIYLMPDDLLGFSIRGGSEHGLGIFVSEVETGSAAERAGILIGDQLIEVNSISFDGIASSSAVKVLMGSDRLKVMIRRVGKIPGYKSTKEKIAWYDVQQRKLIRGDPSSQNAMQLPGTIGFGEGHERKINLNKSPKDKMHLGFNIRGGAEFGLGVYISRTDVGGLAEQNGLKAGDEVVEVNGVNVANKTHSQVVSGIKSQKTLILTVRDAGKFPAFKEVYAEYKWVDVNSGLITKTRSYKKHALETTGQLQSIAIRNANEDIFREQFSESHIDDFGDENINGEEGFMGNESDGLDDVMMYLDDTILSAETLTSLHRRLPLQEEKVLHSDYIHQQQFHNTHIPVTPEINIKNGTFTKRGMARSMENLHSLSISNNHHDLDRENNNSNRFELNTVVPVSPISRTTSEKNLHGMSNRNFSQFYQGMGGHHQRIYTPNTNRRKKSSDLWGSPQHINRNGHNRYHRQRRNSVDSDDNDDDDDEADESIRFFYSRPQQRQQHQQQQQQQHHRLSAMETAMNFDSIHDIPLAASNGENRNVNISRSGFNKNMLHRNTVAREDLWDTTGDHQLEINTASISTRNHQRDNNSNVLVPRHNADVVMVEKVENTEEVIIDDNEGKKGKSGRNSWKSGGGSSRLKRDKTPPRRASLAVQALQNEAKKQHPELASKIEKEKEDEQNRISLSNSVRGRDKKKSKRSASVGGTGSTTGSTGSKSRSIREFFFGSKSKEKQDSKRSRKSRRPLSGIDFDQHKGIDPSVLQEIELECNKALTPDENAAMLRHIKHYESGGSVSEFVNPVLAILDTLDKMKLCTRLRQVLTSVDHRVFDDAVNSQFDQLEKLNNEKQNASQHSTSPRSENQVSVTNTSITTSESYTSKSAATTNTVHQLLPTTNHRQQRIPPQKPLRKETPGKKIKRKAPLPPNSSSSQRSSICTTDGSDIISLNKELIQLSLLNKTAESSFNSCENDGGHSGSNNNSRNVSRSNNSSTDSSAVTVEERILRGDFLEKSKKSDKENTGFNIVNFDNSKENYDNNQSGVSSTRPGVVLRENSRQIRARKEKVVNSMQSLKRSSIASTSSSSVKAPAPPPPAPPPPPVLQFGAAVALPRRERLISGSSQQSDESSVEPKSYKRLTSSDIFSERQKHTTKIYITNGDKNEEHLNNSNNRNDVVIQMRNTSALSDDKRQGLHVEESNNNFRDLANQKLQEFKYASQEGSRSSLHKVGTDADENSGYIGSAKNNLMAELQLHLGHVKDKLESHGNFEEKIPKPGRRKEFPPPQQRMAVVDYMESTAIFAPVLESDISSKNEARKDEIENSAERSQTDSVLQATNALAFLDNSEYNDFQLELSSISNIQSDSIRHIDTDISRTHSMLSTDSNQYNNDESSPRSDTSITTSRYGSYDINPDLSLSLKNSPVHKLQQDSSQSNNSTFNRSRDRPPVFIAPPPPNESPPLSSRSEYSEYSEKDFGDDSLSDGSLVRGSPNVIRYTAGHDKLGRKEKQSSFTGNNDTDNNEEESIEIPENGSYRLFNNSKKSNDKQKNIEYHNNNNKTVDENGSTKGDNESLFGFLSDEKYMSDNKEENDRKTRGCTNQDLVSNGREHEKEDENVNQNSWLFRNNNKNRTSSVYGLQEQPSQPVSNGNSGGWVKPRETSTVGVSGGGKIKQEQIQSFFTASDSETHSETGASENGEGGKPMSVYLDKSFKTMGLSISGGTDSKLQPEIRIKAILPGGAAEAEGSLKTGLQIVEIDDTSLVNVTHMRAVVTIKRSFDKKSQPFMKMLVSD